VITGDEELDDYDVKIFLQRKCFRKWRVLWRRYNARYNTPIIKNSAINSEFANIMIKIFKRN